MVSTCDTLRTRVTVACVVTPLDVDGPVTPHGYVTTEGGLAVQTRVDGRPSSDQPVLGKDTRIHTVGERDQYPESKLYLKEGQRINLIDLQTKFIYIYIY